MTSSVQALLDGLVRVVERSGAEMRDDHPMVAVLDAMPDIVFIKDPQKRFVFVNKAMCVAIGQPRSWFVGKRGSAYLSDEDVRGCEAAEDRVLRGETVREEQVKEINGRVMVGDIVWAPFRVSGGAAGAVTHIIGMARDVTAQAEMKRELIEARDRERKLRRELDHRVRNNLAALASLIRITMDQVPCGPVCLAPVQSRIDAMQAMHALLSGAHGAGVSVREIVVAVTPPAVRGRLAWEGSGAEVASSMVVPLGMALAELATNAEKHGAWSPGCEGRVEVSWSAGPGVDEWRLEWVERHGPRVGEAKRGGIGLELVRGLVENDLRGRVELAFPEAGAHHVLTISGVGPVKSGHQPEGE